MTGANDIHSCIADDCPFPGPWAWAPIPDVVSVKQASPREVVIVCPCRLCDEHVSVDEVVVIGANGHVHHHRCAIEALNDIERYRDLIRRAAW